MAHPSPWKTLLATPIPARPSTPSSKVTRGKASAPNLALWSAIDQNSIADVQQALADGASLKQRRDGQTPLWRAVANGQWDIAETLRAHGADIHAKSLSADTLFSALAGRDQPSEADRLLAWGCDPTQTRPSDFLSSHGAPNLLQWWIEHGNTSKIPTQKTDTQSVMLSWAKTAMKGSPKLRDHLNKAWGVSGKDPDEFPKAFRSHDNVAELLWANIIQKDDVAMARACLESGWGMPLDGMDPCWKMAHSGAWHLLEWFRQVPQLQKNMMDAARQNPGPTWWHAARNNLPSLERVLAFGVDLHQRNEKGQTIAHEALSHYDLKRPIVQWFADHHPEMLDQADDEGKTPIARISKPGTRAEMEAMIMKRTTPKSVASQQPGRRL